MKIMDANLSKTINKVLAEGERSDERDVREATASYQYEFPYERDEESQVTRREFCNFLFLTSTTLFVGAAGFAGKAAYDAQSEVSYAPMKIQGAENLSPGSALNFYYPDEHDTAILVRTKDGEYYAYGQKCTHLSCPVYFEKQKERFECPCHEAGFDARTGNVLYGPPQRPLDKVELEVRNGEVWAIGRKAGSENHEI